MFECSLLSKKSNLILNLDKTGIYFQPLLNICHINQIKLYLKFPQGDTYVAIKSCSSFCPFKLTRWSSTCPLPKYFGSLCPILHPFSALPFWKGSTSHGHVITAAAQAPSKHKGFTGAQGHLIPGLVSSLPALKYSEHWAWLKMGI